LIKGTVFDIRKYSIHDGPGIRTTVFFKGCPLSCWWCHNPEGQAPAVEVIFRESRCIQCGACLEVCDQAAISWSGDGPITDRTRCLRCGVCAAACYAGARECVGRELTVPQVMAEIERDLIFYDESGGGVTISGGEPLSQPDFALALLETCKEQGIHTAVDTCGFVTREVFDRIREFVDLFMYDLKLMDEAGHRMFTGASNELIVRNLQELSERGHRIVLRVPVVPGVNDDDESMRQIGAFAASLPHVDGVDLLPYHHMGVDKYGRLDRAYRLPETRPPSRDRMAEIAHILGTSGLTVRRGG
jgi:pyruvate formate lyase activating enzyme